MRTNKNNVVIIVLIVISLLVITGGIFAYLYFATDVFRTGQELFAKYLTQEIEEISQTISFNKLEEVESKLEQNKYEENITLSYIEEGKTEPLGQVLLNTQNDPIDEKYYGIISLASAESEGKLKLEYMKENDIYALRFTNAVKQFLSIQNGDLKELAQKFGIDEEVIQQIPDEINFEEIGKIEKLAFTKEEKNAEVKKYSELLYNNIAKEKYTKTKNTVITVNGQTITTNAYVLKLNKQDLKNLLIKVLETLKQDEIILAKIQLVDKIIAEYRVDDLQEGSLKDRFVETIQEMIDSLKEFTDELSEDKDIVITVYEEKGKTVRFKIEQGLDCMTLDTIGAENKNQIDMNFISIDEDNTQISNGISFVKENDNKLNIKINNIEGEEQKNNEVEAILVENGNNIKLDVIIYDEEGKTEFTRDITIVEELEYKETLDNTNNIIINDLSKEQISSIFTLVGDKLNTVYVKQFNQGHLAPFKVVISPVMLNFIINQNIGAVEEELESTELETFNMEFQVYEGNDVSATVIDFLLSQVLAHNQREANQLTERYITVSGDIELDVDDTEVRGAEKKKVYTVKCMLENGRVNEIVITENN